MSIRHQQFRARLSAIAEDREKLAKQDAEIRHELYQTVRDAHAGGLGVTEIAKCAKLSRRAVYDILNEGKEKQ